MQCTPTYICELITTHFLDNTNQSLERLIAKYLSKLHLQGLADKEKAVFIALDAEFFSNKPLKDEVLELSKVFEVMNINAILFSEPLEPYRSIISELTDNAHYNQITTFQHEDCKISYHNDSALNALKRIIPMDCETRTFFHDIPVIENFTSSAIAKALSLRKSAIVKNRGIVTYGTVTPEQAYVSYSSTCFAVFVKYFFDSLIYFEYCFLRKIEPDKNYLETFKSILEYLTGTGFFGESDKETKTYDKIELTITDILNRLHNDKKKAYYFSPSISSKPENEQEVIRMLSDTGKAVVKYRLVDSYFGNISYVFDNKIYISQTGSSMDELQGCIDAVPLDGSSTIGMTASSELSTHKNIYYQTGYNAVLHGHPRFSVIMSMYCPLSNCLYFKNRRICHRGCNEKRHISEIPVVSGEIGTGQTGLVNTVPSKMKKIGGVIVYGHGVFTSGEGNFLKPLSLMLDIERICQREYFQKINDYISR